MARKYVGESVPLSRFGVLVAQLESIAASAAQQPPEPLLCFDLLSDLISAIEEEPKESLLLCQRKCEDALYSLLTLGARRPVRHLASVAMAKIISKGDAISIYSRVSSLQGFLSDGKKSEPQRVAGAAQCLGELYKHFGRRITSGLLETTMIATKLIKFYEEFVRQEALYMLQNALEGSGGSAASSAYTEAFRLVMRFAIGDKSFVVRIAAARCLKAFANIGGPGLGVAELENSASFCVKALEDPVSSVRDAFSEALGSLLALGMSPEAQVQPRGKGPVPPAKKLEGFLQRHLALPFAKASGARSKDVRVGLTLSWVFFLQAIHLKYQHPESELQTFALQVMDMLRADTSVDAHALACVLYILRVGVTDQMMEPTQRSFLVFLGKQLQSPDASPSMKISALCSLSYTLKSLGEVPFEFKEVLDDTVVAAISHPSQLVRIEASLTLRTLAEVDLTCVGGLISFGVTTLNALRENVSFEKGSNLQFELDSLHGQASVLAALVSVLPKLPLGYPARLPRSILEVSKKMLTEPSQNLVAAAVENEAGWLLLSSLLASMPKEEIEDQVFDVLSLWASVFSGNLEQETKQTGDLRSKICVWSAAVDALTAFVRCFVCPNAVNSGILLQPVLVYLSSALSYITVATAKEMPNVKHALDIFVIKTLIAYQSLPDPLAYKNDHPWLMQLCTTPFRVASGCEESSCLRLLLDKRDAWLGPWIPGRDWFEDELRAFQGGKDGLMPCVWENELSSFPQPETISKTLVNQMLLCFGVIFASQDSAGMLSLLGMMDHCLKTGKKQSCHAASVTNICIGLLAGFKALLSLRPQPLAPEILGSAQAIFQSVLAEGDICASQRRASSEGLGLLARLGNDMFTARMTRSLLGDLTGAIDSNYAGSIAIALGCLHRSAGGMALSTLVPATVSSISLLAKSSVASLQIWSLHGLLLTIEAAGLSFVTHVPATLGLAMDILLSDENGWVELQQGVGRLINAVVAIIGPELAPGSIFFSHCKSVVAEISSCQETATMLESVRFTQQLVLFAPQAVSVHSHVQSLLPTLSSRQPTLRHLALSTLRHLIEKDPVSIIVEEIEDNLFHMLDEETDSEIGNLARTTIMRLLYASCPSRPSHWIYVCRSMVLALPTMRIDNYKKVMNDPSNDPDGETRQNLGDDDENMVSSSEGMKRQGYRFESSSMMSNREKHLRYLTRVFAAECLSHIPGAVGKNPAHFDLSLARKQPANRQVSSDWLVLHVQELISLAYQISTLQFEHMRPIGVGLLSMIIDKFERIQDPELPGHLLLEQYQAQLVSAVRTSLDLSAGPLLLEAGLQLATKILTSGVISGDQVAVKRIFSLISRPLNDFKELYYPSFAEWVSCKIKIRLLAAHASLKCYTYAFLRRHHSMIPDEYLALLPLFSKNSNILGKYWIQVLKDYSYVCLCLHRKKTWSQFLEGIQSPLVSSKLQPCLEESWPVILQALALDSVPLNLSTDEQSKASVEDIAGSLVSGYNMVELEPVEFHFLWGFSLLVLFQGQNLTLGESKLPLFYAKAKHGEDSPIEELDPPGFNLYEIVLPVFQCLATERYFSVGFLTMDISRELLQVLSYATYMDSSFNSLAISVLSQVVQNCPEDFLQIDNFAYLAMELCFTYLFKMFQSTAATSPDQPNWYELISSLFFTAKTLLKRLESKLQKQLESVVLAFLLIGFKCIREASTDLCFSEVNDFVKCTISSLEKLISENSKLGDEGSHYPIAIIGTCLNVLANLIKECIKSIHLLDNKRSDLRKLLRMKLAFSVEQTIWFAKLVHGIHCLGSNGGGAIYFTLLKYCTECIRMSLVDSNIQVQAIGLQVLKTMVQRALIPEENTFVIFLVGEQIGDIFTLIQQMLKKPLTKESVAVVSECLRILVLLQTLSKGSKSQRGFINLLFEAIVMVFLASEAEFSQEVSDLRSITLKLVSHIAQIPSSAVHFKDVLLSMPPMHRQKLQGVILDSVSQDHNASQMKPLAPLLEVKSSVPTEGTEEKHSPELATTVPSDKNNTEEDGEDEDDWDSFQSFPASTNAAGNESGVVSSAKDPGPVENSSILEIGTGSDDSKEYSISKSLNNAEHPEAGEEEVIADSPGSQVSPQCDAPSNRIGMHEIHTVTQPFHDQLQEKEEEVVQSQGKEAISCQENEQILTDRQPVEVVEGSVGLNVAEDHEVSKDIPDTKLDQTLSGSPLPLQELSGETHREGNRRTEGEPDEANEATQKKMDENNGTDQQQDNVDNLEIPRSEEDNAKL